MMKRTRLLVLTLVVLALAACRGEHSSMTGSYGSGVLSGQVTLSGIDGTPEGVEVSVRDTGMSTTLSADGRFVFSGVPGNAILDFRRADGIQASVTANSTGRPVLVTLGKRGATLGTAPKRGNRNKDKVEFEGTIKTASETEITVLTSHNEEILIGLSTETEIRHGNTTIDPKDLTEGMHVHVRARKTVDPVTEVLTYTAEQVIVQDGDDDGEDDGDKPAVTEYEGTIVSASATELVIFDSHRQEVTFVLNGDTVIRKGNRTVAPADLLPGQRVHVKATVADDGTATATLVILQNEQTTASVSGTVLGVAGSTITVTTKSGQATVQTNASTRFREKGKAISLSDIEAGDSISAKGTSVSANTILASEVEVRGKSGHP
jgi:hypothetical protein